MAICLGLEAPYSFPGGYPIWPGTLGTCLFSLTRTDRTVGPKGISVTVLSERPGHGQVSAPLIGSPSAGAPVGKPHLPPAPVGKPRLPPAWVLGPQRVWATGVGWGTLRVSYASATLAVKGSSQARWMSSLLQLERPQVWPRDLSSEIK